MSELDHKNIYQINNTEIQKEFLRYFSFWPYFLVALIICLTIANLYLRYEPAIFESSSRIEIIDKAQDSEMALPTAMTVFNRSMINLENETGVLKSFSIHSRVVSSLNLNIKYFTNGRLKRTENHPNEWFSGYKFVLNVDPKKIDQYALYKFDTNGNNLIISSYDNGGELINEAIFTSYSTFDKKHSLPFDIQFEQSLNIDSKELEIFPFDDVVNYFNSLVNIKETGKSSDQLVLNIKHPSLEIANDYLNTLMNEFDRDGIVDRQLEYKRTMDFVDARSDFLIKELDLIELKKQNFKEDNNLTNIDVDAGVNINQKFVYDNELFNSKSQRDLINLLEVTLLEENFVLMPINIGIENNAINNLIQDYNILVKERNKFLITAGSNNPLVKNLEKQLTDFSVNIKNSIKNYKNNLDIKISNLEKKESEFTDAYQNIPENEKILRSIERELEVKEALFVLLLQKREEAAINFAVVKPSIKIIDYARGSEYPVSPNKLFTYAFAGILGLLVPFIFLYMWFFLDTKIHTRDQIKLYLPRLPLIGEIPFIKDKTELIKIINNTSRNPLAESVRMVLANLNLVNIENHDAKPGIRCKNIILVTSSVKGEGKTIVSVNAASLLSSKSSKVLLIGADLRNPQIHKLVGIPKNIKGLSDYLYEKNKDIEDYFYKYDNLDILFSGTIPPNPTQILASKKFENLILKLRKDYDYIVIDSAPCLLVSDTFEISKNIDSTIYVIRSNYSDLKLLDFINEADTQNKLSNISLVLNSVGSSQAYGYKYGYQYGYKYGYKYGYNYGYGYGYEEDKS